MDDIEIKDGKIIGGWRAPFNVHRGSTTSIHDDGVAKSIGMRGGTMQGTIHLSMFAPLAQKIFGDRWFEKGTISMYYTFATTDREEVRAIIELPEGTSAESLPISEDDIQVKAWAEMKSGQQIMTGTVSIGDPKESSYIQALDLKNSNHEDLRILKRHHVGDEIPSEEKLVNMDTTLQRIVKITDKLDYYTKGSPWGDSILYPTEIFEFMALGAERAQSDDYKAVPFFGATEIKFIDGPVFVDKSYIAKGNIVCVGASRKTEYLWRDCHLEEKETGKKIAQMRHMDRFMKQGSSLYKDQ